jgi:putative transposase
VICAFIATVAGRFGVVPVCRALGAHGVGISPRTYWARRSRPPSRRAVRDAWLTGLLAGMFEPGEDGKRKPESLYGAVKAWAYLPPGGGHHGGAVHGGAADAGTRVAGQRAGAAEGPDHGP